MLGLDLSIVPNIYMQKFCGSSEAHLEREYPIRSQTAHISRHT